MTTDEQRRAAEEFFHEQIPLTQAMGVRVVAHAETGFAIQAPVALNYNHLHTAFGGSINAIATLAGYGFVWLQLRDEAAHVVIRESSIRFHQPVREEIIAVCETPTPDELQKFRCQLERNDRARLKLRVRVEENGATAATFEGVFVALRNAVS